MSAEKSPEWLPDGWIMEVRRTKSGSKHRYYTSPVSEFTFRTKREVLHYLNIDKVEGHASKPTSCCLADNKQQFVAQGKDSPEWLPTGWILEIKTLMSGAKAGKNYKCYFNPFSGSRFYSKKDVFRYLKAGKLCNLTSDQKRLFNTNSMDNVLAQIQYSPDGLPHGWIKEIKFRRSNRYRGVRKDPYFIDPVTGYIFRSLKDAFHYLETGEISKQTIRSQRTCISDKYSLEKESPPPVSAKKLKPHGTAVRRCLFVEQKPNSDGKMVIHIEGAHEPSDSTAFEHASSQSVEGAGLICSTPSNDKQLEGKAKKRKNVSEPAMKEFTKPTEHFKGNAKKKKVAEPATENLSEPTKQFEEKGRRKVSKPAKHLEGKAMKGREKSLKPAITKLSEPIHEKPSEPSNEIPPDASEDKQLDLEDKKLSEQADQEPSKMLNTKEHEPADTTAVQLLIENPCKQEDVKLLESVSEKSSGAEKLLEPENEKSLFFEEQGHPERGIIKCGRNKAKTKKANTLPRRASKRLAGLEPFPVADIGAGNLSHQSMPKRRSDRAKEKALLVKPECKESLGEQVALGEEAGGAGISTIDWPESPLTLPFGDSWPDPCIEFAFKTLTGDFPVLEDTAAIEDYYQHQLISVQSSSPSASGCGSASITFGSPESCSQAKLPVQLEPPSKSHLSQRDDERSGSLEDG